MTLTSLLVSIGLAVAPAPADSLIPADSAMSLLRHGGFTIMWRHAQTDRSVSDIPGENTERFQQRNLNDAGVALSKSVGTIFKARSIPVGDVFSSPMYRTKETAQYAFGRATSTALLRTMDASADERALVLAQPAAGTNRVLVTHHFIIERNAPGIKPGDIGEGEAAIVKSDGKTLKTIAVIKLADWARMAGRASGPEQPSATHPGLGNAQVNITREMAAILHSGRGFVGLSYLQSFNTGRDAMKAFIETHVVADPARSVEQRLEAYDRLKSALGMMSLASVETVGDDGLVLKATSMGRPVTITFKQEAKAPYRALSISVQAPHGG